MISDSKKQTAIDTSDRKINISKIFTPIENYIYLYHTKTLIILPFYPSEITDTTSSEFQSDTPLGRSAPVYSFSSSGPRSISGQFSVHREAFNQINGDTTLYTENGVTVDYTERIIRELQAAALPEYWSSTRLVDPPIVALRVGDDIFIKGVMKGGVGITYGGPILRTNHYAQVSFSLSIEEIEPYSASQVAQIGSYRYSGDIPINTNLSRGYSSTGSHVSSSGSTHGGGGRSYNFSS